MNKRYISLIIVLLLAIGTLPTLFGQTHFENPEITIQSDGCYQLRLLQSDSAILQPGAPLKYIILQ